MVLSLLHGPTHADDDGGRWGDGRRFAGIWARSDAAASGDLHAGRASAKHCCTGHMTAAGFKQANAQMNSKRVRFEAWPPGLW